MIFVHFVYKVSNKGVHVLVMYIFYNKTPSYKCGGEGVKGERLVKAPAWRVLIDAFVKGLQRSVIYLK